MKLTYPQINDRLLAYFLEYKTFYGQIVLTLDQDELDKLFPEDTLIDTIQCILQYWKKAAHQTQLGQNLGFGIIAVQGIAAYEHSHSGHRVIREKLAELLVIDSSELSSLFKGGKKKKGDTFQDKLWYNAKAYLEEVHNLKVDLPGPRKGVAWRFVQYPYSQALFSLQELQCFTRIFTKAKLFPGAQITMEDFQATVFDRWKEYSVEILKRAEKLLIDHQEKSDLFCRQLYQYFIDWDGAEYKFQFGRVIRSEAHQSGRSLVAEYIGGSYEFSEYEPASEEYHSIDPETFFRDFPGRKAFGLLQLDAGYTNIYSQQKSVVQQDSPFLLVFRLVQPDSDRLYFGYKKIIAEKKGDCQKLTEGVYVCRFEQLEELKRFVDLRIQEATASPVNLQYGLKIGYRTYLKGCGPKIEVSDKTLPITLSKVGSRPMDWKTYDPEEASAGKYVIIIPGYPQISFHIVSQGRVSLPAPQGKGLVYKNWYLQEHDYDIAGCLLQKKNLLPDQNLAREWIKVQTQISYLSPSRATIIQALNRSKYGERKSSRHSV